MNKELDDMTDIELKAMAYDILASLQALQDKLNKINKMLIDRKSKDAT